MNIHTACEARCSMYFFSSEGIKVPACHVSVSSNVWADRSMMDGSQAEARTLAGENGSFLIPADARGRVTSWRRLLLIPHMTTVCCSLPLFIKTSPPPVAALNRSPPPPPPPAQTDGASSDWSSSTDHWSPPAAGDRRHSPSLYSVCCMLYVVVCSLFSVISPSQASYLCQASCVISPFYGQLGAGHWVCTAKWMSSSWVFIANGKIQKHRKSTKWKVNRRCVSII